MRNAHCATLNYYRPNTNSLYTFGKGVRKQLNKTFSMNLLTKLIDITEEGCIVEFWADDIYIYYEFDNNHNIIDKIIWNFRRR